MYIIPIRMSDIGAAELDAVLTALADQLAVRGKRAHIVVIGGSGLIAIGAISRVTRDVDIVALKQDGELVSARTLPKWMVEAAATVARDLGLASDWLNAGPTSLLDHGLPSGLAGRLIDREYGPALQVSFVARIDQIFFKLYAWADRREPRDFSDLQQLDPSAEELVEAARWARTHNMPGPFDDRLAHALDDFGVEDEGRNP